MTVISIAGAAKGVGTSTITLALSEFLASRFKRRVLIMDLSPFGTLTRVFAKDGYTPITEHIELLREMIVSETFDKEWHHLLLSDTSLSSALIKKIKLLPFGTLLSSFLNRGKGVTTAKMKKDCNYNNLQKIFHLDFDYILIDLPINFDIIAQIGLTLSNGFLIVSLPSTTLESFVRQKIDVYNNECPQLSCIGLIVNNSWTATYRESSWLKSSFINNLLLGESVPYCIEMASIVRPSELASNCSLLQLDDEDELFDSWLSITEAFMNRCRNIQK